MSIWRDEPVDAIVEPYAHGYAINRTEFYKAVRQEFEGYLMELRNRQNANVRARLFNKRTNLIKAW